MPTKRMRVIAGPNGSGKSSVYQRIHHLVRMGHYVNPDELGAAFSKEGAVDLKPFGLACHCDKSKREELQAARQLGYRVYL